MPVLAKPEQKLKRDSDLWETDSGLDDMYKRQKQIEEIKRKQSSNINKLTQIKKKKRREHNKEKVYVDNRLVFLRGLKMTCFQVVPKHVYLSEMGMQADEINDQLSDIIEKQKEKVRL